MDASMRGKINLSSWLFGQLYHLYPEDDYLASKYAIELLRGGESNNSIKLLEKIFSKSEGKNFKIGLLLAGLYTSLDQSEQAIKTYEKLVKYNQDQESCVFLVQAYREEKSCPRRWIPLKNVRRNLKKVSF